MPCTIRQSKEQRRHNSGDSSRQQRRPYPDITAVKEEWEPLLTYLTDRDAVIVIDEFPYLIESNEGLPSVIQHLWDTATDESQATLVLTGSAIGMIHTHVLDGGAPLYGRVSQTPNGRLELTQLPFRSIQEFVVPTYDPEERVFVYGVFGGTPRYLSPLDPSQSLGENITRLLCDPNGPLHDEPETVLQMELNEVNTYFSVLESMASGNRSRNEIAQGAGIESTNTSYYFDRLETLQIIEKHHPALADPARAASGLDTRFEIPYSGFISGISTAAGAYELYGENAYADLIEPELPDFVSETFESLCHQAVPALYADYQLTQVPSQWWYKGQEVDVVAPTDESTLIAGEAKFTNTPSAMTCSRTSKTTWSKSIGHPPEVVSRRMSSPCSAALGSNAPSRKLQTSVMTSAYSISPISLPFSRVEPPINAGG